MPSLQYKLFATAVSLLPIRLRLKILFFRRFKKNLNFNSLISFNEKLQGRKIFDHCRLLPIAADKLESKLFVKKICHDIYIPHTLWSGDNVESLNQLNFKKLPDNYVFKANHTSQTIKIIKNGKHISLKDMKNIGKKWLLHDQAGSLGEWAYSQVKPKLFIEEFLDFNNSVPDDYKFFVFHGRVRFIQLDTDRFVSQKRNMFDENWQELDFDYSHPRKFPTPKEPKFLTQMIKMSELIGQDFDFIRVDLYYHKNQVTFGELTVYPGAGFEKFPSIKWDNEFGKYWKPEYLR